MHLHEFRKKTVQFCLQKQPISGHKLSHKAKLQLLIVISKHFHPADVADMCSKHAYHFK